MSLATATGTKPRAIGIVRVSQVNDRDEEGRFSSPEDQQDAIREACERNGWQLLPFGRPELDVSGGLPLDRRPALGPAVHAIERGEAKILVVAYLDRLCRRLETQREVVDRVEAAGGQVHAVDLGRVSHETATQRLSSTMLGAISEYYLALVKEKSRDGQARAVALGRVPWGQVTPGYRLVTGGNRRWEPDPITSPIVRRAFEMRADGETVEEIRAYLREHGIRLSFHGTQTMLRSRTVLGEIHFGNLHNLTAHEPIIDLELFERVQRKIVPRGKRPKSERLLARLGVMRCADCGARMTVGVQTQKGRKYPFYRCPDPEGTCGRPRPSISATAVEGMVIEVVKQALNGLEGRASARTAARESQERLALAQERLDTAIKGFAAAGLLEEPSAVDTLSELRRARDEAQETADQLGDGPTAMAINATDHWDRLTLKEQRALVTAVIDTITVGRGRGLGRVSVTLRSQEPTSG